MNNEAVSEDYRSQINLERKALPIFYIRKKFVKVFYKLNTVIIIGETACGKTTQIPQYIYQAGIQKDLMIGITQPRRVAAITIAERVALERNTTLGTLVGYTVRFDDHTSSETKIKFMTDGILLRESISDPLFLKYSVIILDEAHERTIHTDILFGVVKSAQMIREKQGMPALKLIIMSATMDVDHFSQYFNNAPVYFVKGRQYNVEKNSDSLLWLLFYISKLVSTPRQTMALYHPKRILDFSTLITGTSDCFKFNILSIRCPYCLSSDLLCYPETDELAYYCVDNYYKYGICVR